MSSRMHVVVVLFAVVTEAACTWETVADPEASDAFGPEGESSLVPGPLCTSAAICTTETSAQAKPQCLAAAREARFGFDAHQYVTVATSGTYSFLRVVVRRLFSKANGRLRVEVRRLPTGSTSIDASTLVGAGSIAGALIPRENSTVTFRLESPVVLDASERYVLLFTVIDGTSLSVGIACANDVGAFAGGTAGGRKLQKSGAVYVAEEWRAIPRDVAFAFGDAAIGFGTCLTTVGATCDDGNTTSGDGCSSECQVESGFNCTGLPSMCATPWTALGGGNHGGANWTLADGEVVAGIHTNVGVFTIPVGATVRIQPWTGTTYGNFELKATQVRIDGLLDGSAAGNPSATGPGAGVSGRCGGGGGYGGTGGAAGGTLAGAGGVTYGLGGLESDPWSSDDIAMGSGGGVGNSTRVGGAGGAKVYLEAPVVVVGGEVRANGGTGATDGNQVNGGGGSGGGILLRGGTVSVTGALTAAGGAGGPGRTTAFGGGGSGGRIKVFGTSLGLSAATVNIAGGGRNSSAGTYFFPESVPPTSTIDSPVAGLITNAAPVISGTATDNAGIDLVDVKLVRDDDGQSWDGTGWVGTETWLRAIGRASWTLNTRPGAGSYALGSYTITSRAQDVAGNVETSLNSRQFNWDATPPTGTALSINEASPTGSSTLNLTIAADDATDIYVSGEIVASASTFQWIPYTTALAVQLTPVLGAHSVTVLFRDAVGNSGSQQTATIVYEVAWTLLSGGDHGGADWTLADGEVVAGIHVNVGVFDLPAGATVRVQPSTGTTYGNFELNATEIHLDGLLDGSAAGSPSSTGSGAGVNGRCGGGGGYGGTGGVAGGTLAGAGGVTYGLGGLESDPWSANDIAMGSGGGVGNSTRVGGAGGAKVYLEAPVIVVGGEVRANGGTGATDGNQVNGGGGSGGGILLRGGTVSVTGALTAAGGAGGPGRTTAFGGGGGGGRIKVFGTSLDLSAATVNIAGGGRNSSAGTYFFPESVPPTSTIDSPVAGLITNAAPVISGTATDNAGIDFVDVKLVRDDDGQFWDGTAWVGTETWLRAVGRASWTLNTRPGAGSYTLGSYTITSRAQDVAGNVETSLNSRQFNWDATPPTGTALSINEASPTSSSTLNLTIAADDATEIYVSGDLLSGANTFQWIAYTTTLAVQVTPVLGVHSVTVLFRDAVGNSGSQQTASIDYQVPWTALSGGDHGGADWTLADGEVIAGIHMNVGVFTIPAGATVRVQPSTGTTYGNFELKATQVRIDGLLDGSAAGNPSATGPGAGVNGRCGGGGGYGGTGGAAGGTLAGAGGVTYGLDGLESDPWSSDDIAMGSGGGVGNSTRVGGAGGAKVYLEALVIVVGGEVRANGGTGATDGNQVNGGGGSGGGILLRGGTVSVTGALTAAGGAGGPGRTTAFGGGGGGGRIKVFGTSLDLSVATVNVAGGGRNSSAGTYFFP